MLGNCEEGKHTPAKFLSNPDYVNMAQAIIKRNVKYIMQYCKVFIEKVQLYEESKLITTNPNLYTMCSIN